MMEHVLTTPRVVAWLPSATGTIRRVALLAGISLTFFVGPAYAEPQTQQPQATPQTPTAAVDIKGLQQKAEQGDAKAQWELGISYLRGRGVTRDPSQAATWLHKAADQGYAEAQFNLGSMYDAGVPIPQDYRQAAYWYGKAAAQGHAGAQSGLGVLYSYGRGVPQDHAQALALYTSAAEQGDRQAQVNLGNTYANAGSLVKGEMWLIIAAATATGSERKYIAERRDAVEKEMTALEVADAQQQADAWLVAFAKRKKQAGRAAGYSNLMWNARSTCTDKP